MITTPAFLFRSPSTSHLSAAVTLYHDSPSSGESRPNWEEVEAAVLASISSASMEEDRECLAAANKRKIKLQSLLMS